MNIEQDTLAWQDAIDKLPRIETWHDWGEIFLDVPTWAPLVREICRRVSFPCRTIVPGYPGSNAVFIVNLSDPAHRVVVKIYAPLCSEDYEFERELHPLLAQIPELGAPMLLDHGVLASETRWPYVVLSFIPGEPIREVREAISDKNLMCIAADLGRRVRALHALPLDGVTSLDVTAASWLRYVRDQIPRTIKALNRESLLPQRLLGQIPAYVAEVLDASLCNRASPSARTLSESAFHPGGCALSCDDLVLVSGDITEDHILLREVAGAWRISGLIDFADARIAPRDYEWVALWFGALDRDTGALSAFLHTYDPKIKLDAAFYRRALAFTLLHEFGALIIVETLPRRLQAKITGMDELLEMLWQPGY
jgi:hygromycin-B 7''-O-kinase